MQGVDPETLIDIEDDVEDYRKALILFMYIKDMFKEDERYSLEKFEGRLQLYIHLLVHHFGKAQLQRVLDAAKKNEKKPFAFSNILNLILPENLCELNLRLRYLWCATTQSLTVAFEGQKRQTCQVWNEIGIRIRRGPLVKSFYNLKNQVRLMHRGTPNSSDATALLIELNNSSRMFFSRAAIEIRSHMFCMSPSLPGMTKTFTFLVEKDSAIIAARNSDVQDKYVNSYVCEVIMQMIGYPNLLNAQIIPDENDNEDDYIFEKDLLSQNGSTRRLYLECLCRLANAIDPQSSNPYKSFLLGSYESAAIHNLEQFMQCKWASDVNRLPPADNSSDIGLVNMNDLVSGVYMNLIEKRNTSKFFYREYSFDYLLTNPTKFIYVPPATAVDKLKITDPDDISFYLAFHLCNHKVVSRLGVTVAKYAKGSSPHDFHILTITLAHAVFNEVTGMAFHAMILNNGLKQISPYRGTYEHEVYTEAGNSQPPQQSVSIQKSKPCISIFRTQF